MLLIGRILKVLILPPKKNVARLMTKVNYFASVILYTRFVCGLQGIIFYIRRAVYKPHIVTQKFN